MASLLLLYGVVAGVVCYYCLLVVVVAVVAVAVVVVVAVVLFCPLYADRMVRLNIFHKLLRGQFWSKQIDSSDLLRGWQQQLPAGLACHWHSNSGGFPG